MIHELRTGFLSFGAADAGAPGDLDADGLPDLLLADDDADLHGRRSGAVWTFLGRDGSKRLEVLGDQTYDAFGGAFDAAGDLNGDGHGDFVVGADQLRFGPDLEMLGGTGYVRAFSGRDGAVLWEARGHGAGHAFGSAVCCPGDLDGDGVPEILVGAPGGEYAVVISGRDGSELRRFDGEGGRSLGWGVAAPGDLDKDGVPDLVLYSPGWGEVRSGRTGATLFDFAPRGSPVPVGDLNGDGVTELVGTGLGTVGFFVFDGLAEFASIHSGSDGSLLANFPFGSYGVGGGPFLPLDDLNSDGSTELAVLVPAGGVAVVSGSALLEL